MSVDCAFHIGSTHHVCQDYALSKDGSIIVSDGCSGSINSDIGSRVLGITALNKIKEIDNLLSFDEKECILTARPVIKMLNMPNECLDATLLIAKTKDNILQAMCCGDGSIAIGTKDGDIIFVDCAYTDSYPFFMNYLCDKTGRYDAWQEFHNNRKITQTLISSQKKILSKETTSQTSRLLTDIGVIHILENKIVVDIADKNVIEYIAIMSDGIHSFYETIETDTSRYNKSLTHIDILKELLPFKDFNSSFVQRRINKFKKSCIKNNWNNADDFSLAALSVI